MRTDQRRMPHHIIGKSATTATSAAEAARLTGIDWTVDLQPVTTLHGMRIPDRFATVKQSITEDGVTEHPLGLVSSRYRVIQNAEMFSVLDAVVDSGEARFAAAGELLGGRSVWMLLALPREVRIANDPHAAYMLARTSHDGSTSLDISPVIERLFCTNQISATLLKAGARGLRYTVKHTANAKVSAAQLRDMLDVVYSGIETYEQVAGELMAKQVTSLDAATYVERLFPITVVDLLKGDRGRATIINRQQRRRAEVREILQGRTATMENLNASAFSLFQAAVEWSDWVDGKNATQRAERVVSGKSDAFKARALELARAL